MRPLVIGHAGAAGEAPANTLAGVRRCLEAGADAMEIDVQLSADGVPILLHDVTLDRTTDLKGPVREQTLSALRAADAGGGEWVPALEEVLDLVDGRLTVMCELKSTPGDPSQDRRLAAAVASLLRSRGALRWTAVHSFRRGICAAAREAEPRVSTTLIARPVADADELARVLEKAVEIGAQAVSLGHASIQPDLVRQALLRQLTLWVWTADAEEDWSRLQEAGVDGIITNYPGRLRAFLDRGDIRSTPRL